MADIIAHMTREELKEMIEVSVEQRLLEILGDPDEGLEIRKVVRDRLLHHEESSRGGRARSTV